MDQAWKTFYPCLHALKNNLYSVHENIINLNKFIPKCYSELDTRDIKIED